MLRMLATSWPASPDLPLAVTCAFETGRLSSLPSPWEGDIGLGQGNRPWSLGLGRSQGLSDPPHLGPKMEDSPHSKGTARGVAGKLFPAAQRDNKGHRRDTDINREPGAGLVTSVAPTYRASALTTQDVSRMQRLGGGRASSGSGRRSLYLPEPRFVMYKVEASSVGRIPTHTQGHGLLHSEIWPCVLFSSHLTLRIWVV